MMPQINLNSATKYHKCYGHNNLM